MSEPATVAEGLAAVRRRIVAACDDSGRDPRSVHLVAVSKVHPAERIREAYEAGQRDFGENYVQEMRSKAEALSDLPELRFRLIGHLQRNKAKDAVAVASVVETVDSARLAEALARRAQAAQRRLEVLLQVNVGGEAQKSGCDPDDLEEIVRVARGLDALELRGLMTVPPWSDDPERSRPFFRRLRELAAAYGLPELSMGMSHDLEVAVAEGATIVRVGTAIFGPRPEH